MKVIKISQENISQFHNELDRILRATTNRKGFGYGITVHSNRVAIVDIYFSGKNGRTSQNYVVMYDSLDGWIVYFQNRKIELNTLSELNNVNNKIMRKLVTITRRFG